MAKIKRQDVLFVLSVSSHAEIHHVFQPRFCVLQDTSFCFVHYYPCRLRCQVEFWCRLAYHVEDDVKKG